MQANDGVAYRPSQLVERIASRENRVAERLRRIAALDRLMHQKDDFIRHGWLRGSSHELRLR